MNHTPSRISEPSSAATQAGGNVALVVYALQVAGFFLGGVPALIGIIINYVKLADVRGTWVESHFRWQMRTFWYGLLWGILGALLTTIYIGVLILGINIVWVIYRIVKGWLRLNDKRPMYQP
ncbi:DUF4870 family protein [Castellaniella sp.]|uniref:DUF4870 family protein n=1 Tax=Castellaniella sp. TaxID=1955812 RepID=UPI00355E03F3